MSRLSVDPNWRLVQVFLGRREREPRVYEVYVRIDELDFACTCRGWRMRHRCAHVEAVARHWMEKRPFRLTRKVDRPPRQVVDDPAAFRTWVYENTDVMMLEG